MKNFDTLDVVQQEFRAFYDSNLQDKYNFRAFRGFGGNGAR